MPVCMKCGSDNLLRYNDDSGKCLNCGKIYLSISKLPEELNNSQRIEIEKKKEIENQKAPKQLNQIFSGILSIKESSGEEIKGLIRGLTTFLGSKMTDIIITDRRILLVQVKYKITSEITATQAVLAILASVATGGAEVGHMILGRDPDRNRKLEEQISGNLSDLLKSDPNNLSIPLSNIKGIVIKRGVINPELKIIFFNGFELHYKAEGKGNYDEWKHILENTLPVPIIPD